MQLQREVLVVGSVNVDCTVNVKTLPKAGETIHGTDAVYLPGGKGGNQAVAVAQAKSAVSFISGVGDDAYAEQALSSLKAFGVNTSGVLRKQGPTGTAFIFVEESGENLIVVTPGANALVTPEDIKTQMQKLAPDSAPIVLAQLELPLESVAEAAAITEAKGGRFVLNLAPAVKIPTEMLAVCDPIVVNEYEAAFLLGRPISNTQDALSAVIDLAKLAKSAVITLGGDGAVFAEGAGDHSGKSEHLPAKKVTPVDTTGAGDAFLGALTVALSKNSSLKEAVAEGLIAGTAAVLYFGAQPPKS
jgi:ribokinase